MSNITNIPSAKVPLIFSDTQIMTTEWYRFFNSIYNITGVGQRYSDGELLIGNSASGTLVRNTLTPGTGIGIVNGNGTITVQNDGVTSLIAGAGVTLSSNTGDITISSSGSGGSINTINVYATQGQTAFTAPLYDIGANTLEVYVNGSKQVVGVNYAETSNVLITFITGLNVLDLVQLRVVGSVGSGLSGVVGVTASAPLSSSGGATPNISLLGNIPVTNLNGGTGASSTSFWRGDGTWASLTSSNITTALGYTPANITLVPTLSGANTFTNTNTFTGVTSFSGTTNTFTGAVIIGAAASSGANSITSTAYNFDPTHSIYYSSPNVVISNGVSGQFAFNSSGFLSINGNQVLTTITGAQLAATNTFTGVNNFTTNYSYFTGGIQSASYNFTSGTAFYRDPSSGTFVLYAAAGGQFLYTNTGQAYNTSGTWGTISDARIKTNITPARKYLDSLDKLEVVNYTLKDKSEKMLGFVADQVEQVMPGLVDIMPHNSYGIDDLKTVKISILIPMLVKAVQELKAQVDELKAK